MEYTYEDLVANILNDNIRKCSNLNQLIIEHIISKEFADSYTRLIDLRKEVKILEMELINNKNLINKTDVLMTARLEKKIKPNSFGMDIYMNLRNSYIKERDLLYYKITDTNDNIEKIKKRLYEMISE